jgi:hypothetical protein
VSVVPFLHLKEAETLRPEPYAARDCVKVAVLVQYRGRQAQIVVDPEGDSWDWAVSEYVRTAVGMLEKEAEREQQAR